MRYLAVILLLAQACSNQMTGASSQSAGLGQDDGDPEKKAGVVTSDDPEVLQIAGGTTDGKGDEKLEPKKNLTNEEIDILLVVDNSGSMNDDHKHLSENIGSLLEYIKESNWQIAIISTAKGDCIRGLVKKSNTDYTDKFNNIIKNIQSTPRGDPEVAAEMALYALSEDAQIRPDYLEFDCTTPTSHWLRDSSSVVLIILTDEPPQGSEYSADEALTLLWEKLESLKTPPVVEGDALFEQHTGVSVYGLLDPSHETSWLDWRSPDGDELFDLHGSLLGDFTPVLSDISTSIKERLQKTFTLERRPDAGSLVVDFIDADGNVSYALTDEEYDIIGKVLTILIDVPENVTVRVRYTYG